MNNFLENLEEFKNKHGMAGMADIISKILEKPINKVKSLTLFFYSKSSKL